jgi:hypothetical protein
VGVGRALRRRLHRVVRTVSQVPDADRYRKHFPAEAHAWILLYHVLTGSDSLRQTHAALLTKDRELAALGLPEGVSRSQLARSTTSRPQACFEQLWAASRTLAPASRDPALAQVQAMDSTFLTLSAKLSPWSQHGGHATGVRLHTGLSVADQVPAHLVLTLTDTADVSALATRELTDLRGWTLLIDLGYYAHRVFQRLREHRVSFICPLQAQARVEVTAARDIDPTPTPAGDHVLADETITLGSPNNRAGAVLKQLRLVTSRNAAGHVHRFVTDRFDLTAAEVGALYRQRWQIELFFRWLKHQLKFLHPLGTSRQAVWVTILVAAVAAVLMARVAPHRPPGDSHIQWLRAVSHALFADLWDSS